MAFTVYTSEKSHTWYVNNEKPNVVGIGMLTADGDELELIRMRFENLPITKGNYCEWRDDLAKFIFYNLP